MTSALVGTSQVSQVDDNVAALKNLKFSGEELRIIDEALGQAAGGIVRGQCSEECSTWNIMHVVMLV